MTTYAIMQARIADEIIRTDLTSQIQNAIQSAIQDLEGNRYHFNVAKLLLTTTAGTNTYSTVAGSGAPFTYEDGTALPTGAALLEPELCVLIYNMTSYPLVPVTPGWLDTAYGASMRGQPTHFAIYNQTFRVAPIPDNTYTLRVSSLIKLQTLINSSDSNGWMVDGEKLVRARAKRLLYRDVLRDMEGAQLAAQAEAEAQMALDRKVSLQGGNRLQAWGY